MKCETSPKWRHYGTIYHAIDICFLFGRKSCVKIVRGCLDVQYPNIAAQISIDRLSQRFRSEWLTKKHIRNLTFRVNASIGPARTGYFYSFSFDQRNSSFQISLYGAVTCLHLPSMKVGAVILDE